MLCLAYKNKKSDSNMNLRRKGVSAGEVRIRLFYFAGKITAVCLRQDREQEESA